MAGPKELLDPSGRPVAPVAARVVTTEQAYELLAKKFSEKLGQIRTLPPEEFITKYMQLLRDFIPSEENSFKQLRIKYPDLVLPSGKAELADKMLLGDDRRFMTKFYVDHIDAATEKFDKIIKEKLRGKADPALNELNNYAGKMMEGYTLQDIGNDLIRKKFVTKEQFASILEQATAEGVAEKAEFALISLQYVPKAEAGKTWRESARKGVGNLGETRFSDVRKAIVRAVVAPVDFVRDAEYRADVIQRIKEFDPKFSSIIKGAMVAGLIVGVVFVVGRCSGCWEKTTPRGTRAVPVIAKEAAPLAGIDNALTELKGIGSRTRRESIFKVRDGEEYARQITSQVKSKLSDPNEQQRAFQIIRSLLNKEEGLARNPEALVALVGAIAELQKAKKTVEELSSAAYRILIYYQPGAFVNIAKDIVSSLAKDSKADAVALASEPDRFFPNKYTKQMTAEWSQRPFQAFSDMGFDVNRPFVKNASAMIRQYFDRDDWDAVATAMAEFYKNREYMASRTLPSAAQKPEVPNTHELHLALLAAVLNWNKASAKTGETPGKTTPEMLEMSMGTLRLFVKNVNPAMQWSAEQRKNLPIWQLAATQLLALNPNSATLDEKLETLLSANPGWKITGSTLGQGRGTSALINSLAGAESKAGLNAAQQKAFTDALAVLFVPERQLEVANAIIQELSKPKFEEKPAEPDAGAQSDAGVGPVGKAMTEAQLQEAVNGYGFEAKAGWRARDWNFYMDRELYDYFPKDANGRLPREMGQVASVLHGLATHGQYLAAREALMKFADKFEKKNSAEASPKALLDAAARIVSMVREAKGEPDTGKMSDKALGGGSETPHGRRHHRHR